MWSSWGVWAEIRANTGFQPILLNFQLPNLGLIERITLIASRGVVRKIYANDPTFTCCGQTS
jgi:hypothetical protein